ncbi:uncharacterized protein A1O9_10667 [Exophiala aquamarina CBS 119918]|uniref:PAS domain-containing protein n=1 Tax=Exophiala aquamarina CBS 119918 TaxID=1182545 RepID=A0A072NZB2_9EURO|nr:uncharacterized protein A1O9_10667 [Exophiala aquamarina CBS 119918]KEF53219.1 hypothetical protein A1O9_10667 [Exophiala aquamarina CBS 119918]
MTAKKPLQPHPISYQRKSLKQSLKDVFSFGKSKKSEHQSPQTVGSGILRRAEPSAINTTTAISHQPSSYSLFSDFSTSQSSLAEYTVSASIPNRFQTPPRQSTTTPSGRQSLLPARSLSQFNLNHQYFQHSTVPHRQVTQVMSPTLTSVVSHEASVSSFASLTTYSSVSTLRVQDSRRDLLRRNSSITFDSHLHGRSSTADHFWESRARPLRTEQKHVSWLQSPSNSTVNHSEIASAESHEKDPADPDGDDPLVEHFKSFCILDTNAPGYPVIATSQELRYIFSIGEQFFLNSLECEGASMDIVTGKDAAGDPITHLVLFTPLIIPSSGRSRFMLASLIDVTRFINDAASLPELEKASNTSTIESDLRSPVQDPIRAEWSETAYKLSSEDLLGGCVLPQDRHNVNPNSHHQDDIWLNLANEERSSRTPNSSSPPHPRLNASKNPGSSNASHASAASSNVDDVLDEFMSGLQELYSDFFLLGKSPLDDTYYEICNVSPMLFATKDYIHGHLSHTGPEGIAELSARLAQASPFDLDVKWGDRGQPKRLYCSPLYGQNSTTWICFLVDHHIPALW